MKVRLSVVKGRGFRWNTRTGQAIYPPIVGKPFVLVARKGTVKTSPVVSLDGQKFTTESGAVFEVELLDALVLKVARKIGARA